MEACCCASILNGSILCLLVSTIPDVVLCSVLLSYCPVLSCCPAVLLSSLFFSCRSPQSMLPMLSSCTSANDNPQSDPSVHAQPHCMLLFLGVPEGTELGIDYNVWETGPRFKGLSGVPCGMHFIYYSTGTFRSGFFLNIITDDQACHHSSINHRCI